MSDLIRRALAVNRAMLGLGQEVFEADGGVFVRNRALPSIYDANHVTGVSAATPEQVERLLARVEREFAGYEHRRFDLDCTTPPAFAARLALDGYDRADFIVMLLDGALRAVPAAQELQPITDERGWAAYAVLKQLDWEELAARLGMSGDAAVGTALASMHRMKSPPMQYWLAYGDGQPRGFCAAWEGLDGIGQVEDLFVHPDYRHRGLATALIHQCVAVCRERGAGPVVIVADATDTPKQMYATLGFQPVAVKHGYLRLMQ